MCAGNQLASRQLYIMLLRLIWSFKIELSKDPSENNWGIHPLLVSLQYQKTLMLAPILTKLSCQDSVRPDEFAARPPGYKIRFTPRDPVTLNKMLKA